MLSAQGKGGLAGKEDVDSQEACDQRICLLLHASSSYIVCMKVYKFRRCIHIEGSEKQTQREIILDGQIRACLSIGVLSSLLHLPYNLFPVGLSCLLGGIDKSSDGFSP